MGWRGCRRRSPPAAPGSIGMCNIRMGGSRGATPAGTPMPGCIAVRNGNGLGLRWSGTEDVDDLDDDGEEG